MPKLQKSNKIVCVLTLENIHIFERQTKLFLTFENIYIPHWKLAKNFYKKTHGQKIRGHEKGNLGIGQEETSYMFSFLS